jgi:hypothetical protein
MVMVNGNVAFLYMPIRLPPVSDRADMDCQSELTFVRGDGEFEIEQVGGVRKMRLHRVWQLEFSEIYGGGSASCVTALRGFDPRSRSDSRGAIVIVPKRATAFQALLPALPDVSISILHACSLQMSLPLSSPPRIV